MSKIKAKPIKKSYKDALGIWVGNPPKHREFEDRPIKAIVGPNGETAIIKSDHPFYRVTKWYGNYEEL
jgi:hypothetical protein